MLAAIPHRLCYPLMRADCEVSAVDRPLKNHSYHFEAISVLQ